MYPLSNYSIVPITFPTANFDATEWSDGGASEVAKKVGMVLVEGDLIFLLSRSLGTRGILPKLGPGPVYILFSVT